MERLLCTTGAWAPDGPAPASLPSTTFTGSRPGEGLGDGLGEGLGEGAALLPPLLDLDLGEDGLLALGVDAVGRADLSLPAGALKSTLGFISLILELGLGSNKLPKISKGIKLHRELAEN